MRAQSLISRPWWPFAFSTPSLSLVAASMAGDEQHSGLVRWQQAMHSAGLGSIVRRPSSALTLLPPTDAAFEALLTEQNRSWNSLMTDRPSLRRLLLGHILPARLVQGLNRTMGENVIRLHGNSLFDAQQRCAQQRMQGLDRVLLPPQRSLMATLHADPALRAFARLLQDSGLDALLQGQGPFTVIAPCASGLLRCPPLSTHALISHLIPGHWLSAELPWGGSLRNANADTLHFSALGLIEHDQPLLPGSDLLARHGVIHRISRPLSVSPH